VSCAVKECNCKHAAFATEASFHYKKFPMPVLAMTLFGLTALVCVNVWMCSICWRSTRRHRRKPIWNKLTAKAVVEGFFTEGFLPVFMVQLEFITGQLGSAFVGFSDWNSFLTDLSANLESNMAVIQLITAIGGTLFGLGWHIRKLYPVDPNVGYYAGFIALTFAMTAFVVLLHLWVLMSVLTGIGAGSYHAVGSCNYPMISIGVVTAFSALKVGYGAEPNEDDSAALNADSSDPPKISTNELNVNTGKANGLRV